MSTLSDAARVAFRFSKCGIARERPWQPIE
jgi:hypothetical protein